jgi:hypothetical protein
MGLIYNEGKESVPNILRRAYKYTNITNVPSLKINNRMITINFKKRVDNAWKYIQNNCAKNKDCDAYFKKLSKGMTLTEILGKDVIVHHLTPKDGYEEFDLPEANSAGKDIGFSIWAFIDGNKGVETTDQQLAATLLHELAHFGGATSDSGGDHALDAENSLIPCGLKQFFNKDAKG